MAASRAAGYRVIVGFLRLAVHAFFRRVEVTGVADVPARGGGLVVSWHPNGLVDPGLVLTHIPRRIVFGARHGLFAYPLLGRLLRQIGTVPIYRAIDRAGAGDQERRAANRRSLDALAGEIAGGSFAALFPEGISHDQPFVAGLKTGAARLYYRARALAPDAPPAIVPVGLHYDKKQMFRSHALVAFHPPLQLPPELDVTPADDEPEEVERARVEALTALLEHTLREVVNATDDWQLHDLMHRTRRLVRAERAFRAGAQPGRTSMEERAIGFARVRAGYYTLLERDPAKVAAVRARIERYDADLRALELEDYDLDHDPKLASGWLPALVVLQALTVFFLLPPVVLLGYVVNLPTAALLAVIARVAARKEKDEATVKLLVGCLLFPLTWIALGVAAGFGHVALHQAFPRVPDAPVAAGVTTALLAAVGGMIAIRYLRVAREAARSVRVRLTRRQRWVAVGRLRAERSRLFEIVDAIGREVELPGEVQADGKVLPRG